MPASRARSTRSSGRRRLAFVSKTPGTHAAHQFLLARRGRVPRRPARVRLRGRPRRGAPPLGAPGRLLHRRARLARRGGRGDGCAPPADRARPATPRLAARRRPGRPTSCSRRRTSSRRRPPRPRSPQCAGKPRRHLAGRPACSSSRASRARGSARRRRRSRRLAHREKTKPRLKGNKAGAKRALIGIKAPAQGGEAGKELPFSP